MHPILFLNTSVSTRYFESEELSSQISYWSGWYARTIASAAAVRPLSPPDPMSAREALAAKSLEIDATLPVRGERDVKIVATSGYNTRIPDDEEMLQ